MAETWNDAWAEYAKTDDDACRVCMNKIQKGSMRMGYGYWKTRWYHLPCFILADDPFKHQRGVRYTVEYFRRRSHYFRSDKMNEADFVDLGKKLDEYHTNKAKLKLEKHIFEMKRKELTYELKLRHLLVKGNKHVLQNRLRNYLQDHVWCKQQQRSQNEKLMSGFMRNEQKEHDIQIPAVLEKLVLSFYPQIVL